MDRNLGGKLGNYDTIWYPFASFYYYEDGIRPATWQSSGGTSSGG